MNAISCCSTKMDPYRAGFELGTQLASVGPEVIFLFPSSHYGNSAELVEAIYDALDDDQVILIGNTGDGFYECNHVAHAGVSALGINSGGRVRWHLACEENACDTPADAAKKCMALLDAACGAAAPAFYFLSCDFRMDTTELIKALQTQTTRPVVGGSAADDFSFKSCHIYVNRRVLENSVAMLAVEGDLAFEILVSHEMHSIGNPGTITDCHSTSITTINNMPAEHFIEQETGRPLNALDEGILALKLMRHDSSEQRLRSLLRAPGTGESSEGKIHLFGGVEQGDIAQICYAPPQRIIEDMGRLGKAAKQVPFKPAAGLVVSCAGRKRVLGDMVAMEIEQITKECPELTALAGYPSFGEFAPLKNASGYSRALFHNMTCILLLIGDSRP